MTRSVSSPPSFPWPHVLLRTCLAVLITLSLGACDLLGIGDDGGPSPTPETRPDASLISHEGQKLFRSGGNIAWDNFAHDVGPGTTDMADFRSIFDQVHNHQGNTLRFWVHINGARTPAWDDSAVTGPGANTIADLRTILDAAQERGIGLILCLWSFDMLRKSYGPDVTDRAQALLTQEGKLQSYIDNALIPMVEALGNHPALLAWEIFNEPEGMSNEYGWDFTRHVQMSDIQRFVNRTAGAIHRTNSAELVTNGSWSLTVLTDASLPALTTKMSPEATLSSARVRAIQQGLSRHYRRSFTADEARQFYETLRTSAQRPRNYYTDQRLIAAGGDEEGTLDFYQVHYYEWAGTSMSPFHHDVDTWGLDKPLLIGEFFLGGGEGNSADGNPDAAYGVEWQNMYTTLHERGYAGALGWQWFDWDRGREGLTQNWPRALDNMQTLANEHPEDVALFFNIGS